MAQSPAAASDPASTESATLPALRKSTSNGSVARVGHDSPLFYGFANDERARILVDVASDAFVHLRHSRDNAAHGAAARTGLATSGNSRSEENSANAQTISSIASGGTEASVFPAIFSTTTREFERVLAVDPNAIDGRDAVDLLKRLLRCMREGIQPTASPGVAPQPGRQPIANHAAPHLRSPGGGYGMLPESSFRPLKREASADSLRHSMTHSPAPNQAIACSPFLTGLAQGYGSFRTRHIHFANVEYASAVATPASPGIPTSPTPHHVQEYQHLIREPSENPNSYVHDDVDDDVVGASINGFVLLGDLGKGSFGRVMLGCHQETDEIVAIKIVHKSILNRERRAALLPASSTADTTGGTGAAPAAPAAPPAVSGIRKEIAVMKRLKHPHLVALKAVIDDPQADRLYLVMQYIPHGTFLPRLTAFTAHRTEALPEPKARRYSRQLISALRYLHANNIVHRDVKPENILRGDDDMLYLADFGVSEIVEDLEVSRRVTGTHGTPAFWAPEMFEEETREIDGVRQDEWALSVTVYLMLVGRLPFDGANIHDLAQAVRSDPLIVPDSLSPEARDFLHKALAKDPQQRLTLDKMRRHAFIGSRVRSRLVKDIRQAAAITAKAPSSPVAASPNRCLGAPTDASSTSVSPNPKTEPATGGRNHLRPRNPSGVPSQRASPAVHTQPSALPEWGAEPEDGHGPLADLAAAARDGEKEDRGAHSGRGPRGRTTARHGSTRVRDELEGHDLTGAVEAANIIRVASVRGAGASTSNMPESAFARTNPFPNIGRAESASLSGDDEGGAEPLPVDVSGHKTPIALRGLNDPDSPTREGSPTGLAPAAAPGGFGTFHRLTALAAEMGPLTPNHARAAARAALGRTEFSLRSPDRVRVRRLSSTTQNTDDLDDDLSDFDVTNSLDCSKNIEHPANGTGTGTGSSGLRSSLSGMTSPNIAVTGSASQLVPELLVPAARVAPANALGGTNPADIRRPATHISAPLHEMVPGSAPSAPLQRTGSYSVSHMVRTLTGQRNRSPRSPRTPGK